MAVRDRTRRCRWPRAASRAAIESGLWPRVRGRGFPAVPSGGSSAGGSGTHRASEHRDGGGVLGFAHGRYAVEAPVDAGPPPRVLGKADEQQVVFRVAFRGEDAAVLV